MTKLRTASEVNKLVKAGTPVLASVDKSLAIEVKSKGVATWKIRFQLNKRRYQAKLGVYTTSNNGLMTYFDAKALAAEYSAMLLNGDNPLIEIDRLKQFDIKTVNDLFDQFCKIEYADSSSKNTIKRIYHKEIEPLIGHFKAGKVLKIDLENLLQIIINSKRKSIAHKALYLCKNLFSYAAEHNLVNSNVAASLNVKKHAGGQAKARKHILMSREIKSMFQVFSSDRCKMTEQTYIGVVLLLILGVRKMELFSAEWSDFDWDESTFYLFEDNTKTSEALAIPLPKSTVPLFRRLKELSSNSIHLFPSRNKKSKHGHLCESTLNRAIKAFFKRFSTPTENCQQYLDDHGVEYFIPHDFRRTFRSRIAKLGVSREVAEMCLNHRKSNIEETYNLHDYFDERLKAHDLMAKEILPMAGFEYTNEPINYVKLAA